ncbi:hypothetical protein RCL1_002221 [Eukaryota sp. TZLM3-RCL]
MWNTRVLWDSEDTFVSVKEIPFYLKTPKPNRGHYLTMTSKIQDTSKSSLRCCSLCKKPGHNKRTCPLNESPEVPTPPQPSSSSPVEVIPVQELRDLSISPEDSTVSTEIFEQETISTPPPNTKPPLPLLAQLVNYSAEQVSSLTYTDTLTNISFCPTHIEARTFSSLLPKSFIEFQCLSLEEDTQIEFKRDLSNNEEVVIARVGNHILRYTNALINSTGGALYIGIADDGLIRGVLLSDSAINRLKSMLFTHLSESFPKIPPNFVSITSYPVILKKPRDNLPPGVTPVVLLVTVLAHKRVGPGSVVVSSKGVAWERIGAATNRIPERFYPAVDQDYVTSLSCLPLSIRAALKGVAQRSKSKTIIDQSNLPIYNYTLQLLNVLNYHKCCIVTGGTGTGKSTQLPQIILDSFKNSNFPVRVLIAQPRRLAAVSLASHVAHQRGCVLGSEVGYHIGGRKVHGDTSKIVFCTVGVLMRLCLDDQISSFSHVIVDEVHERSIEVDLSLVLLKQKLQRNIDLRVILCSATANVAKLAQYMGGYSLNLDSAPLFTTDSRVAPIISVGVPKFPVSEFYLENLDHIIHEPMDFALKRPRFHSDVLLKIVIQLTGELFPGLRSEIPTPGSILIFLPGLASISEWAGALSLAYPEQLTICIAHSTVAIEEQEQIFSPAEKGKIKIVLATDIAESSLTVPDVTVVIDCCIKKSLVMNHQTRQSILKEVWVSKDCAIQRKGRTGRLRCGSVYRLIPKKFFQELPDFSAISIQNSDLESVLLNICAIELSPIDLLQQTLDPPSLSSISSVIQSLVDLGAIRPLAGSGESVFIRTPLGQFLSTLPTNIEHALLIVYGVALGLVDEAIILSSILLRNSPILSPRELSTKAFDAYVGFSGGFRSDHVASINAYNLWVANFDSFKSVEEEKEFLDKHFLSGFWLREIDDSVYQIRSILAHFSITKQPSKMDAVRRLKSLWIKDEFADFFDDDDVATVKKDQSIDSDDVFFDDDSSDDVSDGESLGDMNFPGFEPVPETVVPCFELESLPAQSNLIESVVDLDIDPNDKTFIDINRDSDTYLGIIMLLGAVHHSYSIMMKPDNERSLFAFRDVTFNNDSKVILKSVNNERTVENLKEIFESQLSIKKEDLNDEEILIEKMDSVSDYLVEFKNFKFSPINILPKSCFSAIIERSFKIPTPYLLPCQQLILPPFTGHATRPQLCFFPSESFNMSHCSLVYGYGIPFDSLISFGVGPYAVATNCIASNQNGRAQHFGRSASMYPLNWNAPHFLFLILYGSDISLSPVPGSTDNSKKCYILSYRFHGVYYQRTFYIKPEIVVRFEAFRLKLQSFLSLYFEHTFASNRSTLVALSRAEITKVRKWLYSETLSLLEGNEIAGPPVLINPKGRTAGLLRDDQLLDIRKLLGLSMSDAELSDDDGDSGSESD